MVERMKANGTVQYAVGMAEKKKPFPSRANVKYVPIPKSMWAELKALGAPDERSVSYMTRRAVREFIERSKRQKAD